MPNLDQGLRHRYYLSVREQQALIRANVNDFLERMDPNSADNNSSFANHIFTAVKVGERGRNRIRKET